MQHINNITFYCLIIRIRHEELTLHALHYRIMRGFNSNSFAFFQFFANATRMRFCVHTTPPCYDSGVLLMRAPCISEEMPAPFFMTKREGFPAKSKAEESVSQMHLSTCDFMMLPPTHCLPPSAPVICNHFKEDSIIKTSSIAHTQQPFLSSLPYCKQSGLAECEGWLRKLSSKGQWQNRYFVLNNGYLNYYGASSKQLLLASINLAKVSCLTFFGGDSWWGACLMMMIF